jgi:sporulation protein YlmC with PRC-barrel domain
MHKITIAASLLLALTIALPDARAQVAGGTTSAGVVETTQVTMGWSVKKTLLGKSVHNETGQKVGTVEDLIVTPERTVSFVIVSAGGFVGIGRHNVAVPAAQVKEQAGKLVMAGATKDSIKAMPTFEYADDATQRARFVANAEKEITRGHARLTMLQGQLSEASAAGNTRAVDDITVLRSDVKAAEARLAEMKLATASRWKEFEASVSAATARLRTTLNRSAD